MPKLTNSFPKYRKHKASGQAVVVINRVCHYRGHHGTRTSKLDRVINGWLARGRSTSFGRPEQALTIVELLAD